jgi:hypothetical protein
MAFRPVTNIMLQVYLCILSCAEVLIIARLWYGESITSVVPVFSAKKDSAFILLFCVFATMLMCVRLTAAMTPVSVAAWRGVAATHVAEAIYVSAVAFGAGEGGRAAIPRNIVGEWKVEKHLPVVLFLFIVIANASLFIAVALAVRHAEQKFQQKEHARRAGVKEEAALKAAKAKAEADKCD